MQQIPIKLGPLALLLTVISICLTVLSILTFTTARADRSLAETWADTVSCRYALEMRGQEALAALDAETYPSAASGDPDASGRMWEAPSVPDAADWTDGEDGTLSCTLAGDGFRLRIIVQKETDGSWQVLSWRHERVWEEDTDIGNLW